MSASPDELIKFAEEFWGMRLTEVQKEMLRGMSEGRIYVHPARCNGKTFLRNYLGQWIVDEETAEPSTIPYSLDYDSLMEGVSA